MNPLQIPLLASITISLSLGALAASADDNHERVRRVDCDHGDRISRALRRGDEHKPLTILVRGTCVENVEITRDDVTIQGDPAATLQAADPARSVITFAGARRGELRGVTVAGGRTGVDGRRGATYELSACVIQGNSRFGVSISYGGTAIVDNCIVRNNGSVTERGGGLLTANGAQLVITNSTVENNIGFGLFAGRNAHLRIGQDFDGSVTPGPVTVSGNSSHGVIVQEAASGIVVGSTVENNGANGILAASSSSVSVGAGSAGYVSPTVVRSNTRNGVIITQSSRGLVQGGVVENNGNAGVRIEGAAATVIGAQIRGNGSYGIASLNSGSARIGLSDENTPSGNTIENNVLEGVHVVGSSSAWMYGNLIRGNGTTNARYGVLAIENSSVRLFGQNTITQNGSVVGTTVGGGILLRDSTLNAQRGDLNVTPNSNDISGNTGDGILAIDGSDVALRDGVTVQNNSNAGINLVNQSVLRAQDTVATGNTAGDIRLFLGSSMRFGPAGGPVTFGTLICGDAESSVGGIALPPGCTGF
jgi:hypothetical protein